jgi:predicted dienelactone hydrolase
MRGVRPAGGGQRPQVPFRAAGQWNESTYADRREDLEAVLNLVLTGRRFEGISIDATRVGLAGHSLGGYTVLGLAGGWPAWKDSRVKAVLALSPYCSPYAAKGQLGRLKTPVMYQGGTRDSGVTPTVKKPGGAYDQSSKPKYYVEFEGAGHLAWTNLNKMYAPSIEAYSVAFFDAYLKGETAQLEQSMGNARSSDVSDLRAAR